MKVKWLKGDAESHQTGDGTDPNDLICNDNMTWTCLNNENPTETRRKLIENMNREITSSLRDKIVVKIFVFDNYIN